MGQRTGRILIAVLIFFMLFVLPARGSVTALSAKERDVALLLGRVHLTKQGASGLSLVDTFLSRGALSETAVVSYPSWEARQDSSASTEVRAALCTAIKPRSCLVFGSERSGQVHAEITSWFRMELLLYPFRAALSAEFVELFETHLRHNLTEFRELLQTINSIDAIELDDGPDREVAIVGSRRSRRDPRTIVTCGKLVIRQVIQADGMRSYPGTSQLRYAPEGEVCR